MVKKGDGANLEIADSFIKWFFELKKEDIPVAGGKGANLGEMFNSKFPVPPGFVITAQAFDYFLTETGIRSKIFSIIKGLDLENTEELEKASKEIRTLVESQRMPPLLKDEILEGYHILSTDKSSVANLGVSQDALNILKSAREPIFVSVRSSSTAEDLAEASFAGQQESFLNVKGDEDLIEFVKKCFSSLYTGRAIYYRDRKGFAEDKTLLAVVIQKMINSEKSGVVFSRDPMGSQDNIVVEAVWGLGEGIVSGMINPDNYVVNRNLDVEKTIIANKKIAIVRSGSGENATVKLTTERANQQVLTAGQISELGDYAIKLEDHYGKPQDIEFAVENNKIYIVQSRPITTLKSESPNKNGGGTLTGKVILSGQGASPGIGVGPVKIVHDLADLSKIKKGDILVTKMTNPDMVMGMQKSVGIVTDEGGMTSHAAIVSREMGIPAVVGTSEATSLLKDGMNITVDGTNGKVYEGEISKTRFVEVTPIIPTKLKIKIILDLPEFAERAAQSGIDSVGLLRLEGIIASSSKHPLLYEKENKLGDYTNLLKEGIDKISKHFKTIWIRTSDIRTDEYSTLKGAPTVKELNPMLGLHGIRFSLKHPKIFEAELLAIQKVAEKYPDKTFGIMFPQIISVSEVKKAKEILNKFRTKNMEMGVMIETPAAVQIIEDLCREKINFVSFGTNDLTQYTLAVDRGNEEVQYLYNEFDRAVRLQLRRVINVCRKYNVTTSICGQAGSNEKMISYLMKKGISSISVNADAAHEISVFVKKLEDEEVANPSPVQNKNLQKKVDSKPIERIDDLREIEDKSAGILSEIRKKNQEQIESDRKEREKASEKDNILGPALSEETVTPEDMGVYSPDEKEEPSRNNTFKYNFDY